MIKIPVHNYSADGLKIEIVEYVIVEESTDVRLKRLLDDSSKSLMFTAIINGNTNNYVFPVKKVERFIDDPLYLVIRHIADLPKNEAKMLFKHVGLLASVGGIRRLIWREKCILTNTNPDVHFDIPLFVRMELND